METTVDYNEALMQIKYQINPPKFNPLITYDFLADAASRLQNSETDESELAQIVQDVIFVAKNLDKVGDRGLRCVTGHSLPRETPKNTTRENYMNIGREIAGYVSEANLQ